jgi:hypothetical protein
METLKNVSDGNVSPSLVRRNPLELPSALFEIAC